MNRKSQGKGKTLRLLIMVVFAVAIVILEMIGILYFTCTSSENLLTALIGPKNVNVVYASSSTEWTQEAHDAQRTGFTFEEPAEPWTLAWFWNGPDANGGPTSHTYNAPPEAHTITGGDFVYVPAGTAGLFALRKSDGTQVWHLTTPAFNATPAYDPQTEYLYAGGANGSLYKINSETGAILGSYAAGGGLNKAVLLVGSSAYVLTDSGNLHKVDTATMSQSWIYTAGANVSTPAAYSANAGLVVYCTADLYVHAVRASDGVVQWKVKPTSHTAQAPYTFEGYWPVVAEQHGVVFVRLNLELNALWSGNLTGTSGGGVYPLTNADIRTLLQSNNGALENLFALDLSNGSQKFVPAVGYGGVEYRPNGSPDFFYLQSGPMPVVKITSDGSEVAYIPFRSGQGNPPDGRWDSHMGEMVLDATTVPGLQAGDMRYVDFPNSYVKITDEQTPFTMAGNTLFHAHWGASESTKIFDRSAGLGLTAGNPIPSQAHPTIIRRQQSCSDFNPHDAPDKLRPDPVRRRKHRNGPGFWVYWNTMDPPASSFTSAYSEGLLPRYTYASDGLMIVEGNGGDLSVFRYGEDGSKPTTTPHSTPSATATRTQTQTVSATRTPTQAATATVTSGLPNPGDNPLSVHSFCRSSGGFSHLHPKALP